jgi:hypothetical protein
MQKIRAYCIQGQLCLYLWIICGYQNVLKITAKGVSYCCNIPMILINMFLTICHRNLLKRRRASAIGDE